MADTHKTQRTIQARGYKVVSPLQQVAYFFADGVINTEASDIENLIKVDEQIV